MSAEAEMNAALRVNEALARAVLDGSGSDESVLANEVLRLRAAWAKREREYQITRQRWNIRKRQVIKGVREWRSSFRRLKEEHGDFMQFGAAVFNIRWQVSDECQCVACLGLRELIPENRGRSFLEELPRMVDSARKRTTLSWLYSGRRR